MTDREPTERVTYPGLGDNEDDEPGVLNKSKRHDIGKPKIVNRDIEREEIEKFNRTPAANYTEEPGRMPTPEESAAAEEEWTEPNPGYSKNQKLDDFGGFDGEDDLPEVGIKGTENDRYIEMIYTLLDQIKEEYPEVAQALRNPTAFMSPEEISQFDGVPQPALEMEKFVVNKRFPELANNPEIQAYLDFRANGGSQKPNKAETLQEEVPMADTADNKNTAKTAKSDGKPQWLTDKIEGKAKGKGDSKECKPCKGKAMQEKDKGKSKKCCAYRVTPEHNMYVSLLQKAAKGVNIVKLADQNTYEFSLDSDNNMILKLQNSSKIMKESQTVSPKVVKLEDDPDIKPVKADETHSMAADEKKPSEGMSEPSVPEAPNGGRLTNEKTVEKAKNGPDVPAGGGTNPAYDENDKNTPEKLDQMLGKSNEVVASTDEVTKLAGRMLKANLIAVDELPTMVKMLSKATPEILKDYETRVLASSSKGLQKAATAGAVENIPIMPSGNTNKVNFTEALQSLMTLQNRNNQYEKYMQE